MSELTSGLTYLRAIAAGDLPTAPIANLLGMRIRSVDEGRVVFEMESGEHLYNPIGLVHGGVIATLVDSVAGCAIHSGLITATGQVVRVGRSIAHATAEAVDTQGRLLATTQVTCAALR